MSRGTGYIAPEEPENPIGGNGAIVLAWPGDQLGIGTGDTVSQTIPGTGTFEQVIFNDVDNVWDQAFGNEPTGAATFSPIGMSILKPGLYSVEYHISLATPSTFSYNIRIANSNVQVTDVEDEQSVDWASPILPLGEGFQVGLMLKADSPIDVLNSYITLYPKMYLPVESAP